MVSQAKSREAALRGCLEGMAQAIRDRNADVLMAYYAPDVVVYDVFPPLDLHGAEAYRKNFERWFSSVQGQIGYEMRDLHITHSESHATCRYLGHVAATTNAGQASNYWVRVTTSLESKSGQWLVTHEHISMPAKR